LKVKIDYLDKFRGTLFGVAIGDTLGHPFEGQTRAHVLSRFSNFEQFLQNNKFLFNTYTDDTQLTLHTAQALINGDGFDLKTFIKEYIKWLEDPPIGPGYGCYSSIRKLKQGIDWKQAASHSGGNGTVMRIAPIGLFYNKSLMELKNAAIQSSKITHLHPAGELGAVIIARAIAFLVNIAPKENFSLERLFEELISSINYAQNDIGDEFRQVLKEVHASVAMNLSLEAGLIKFSQIGVKKPYFIEEFMGKAFVHPYAMSTVACALFIFLSLKDSFKRCLYELATSGGDTDTVAAIGGSLIGAYKGFNEIPADLIDLIRDKKKILKIADELYAKYCQKYSPNNDNIQSLRK